MNAQRDPAEPPETVVARRSASGRPTRSSGAPIASEVRQTPLASRMPRANDAHSASDAALAEIMLAEEATRARGFAALCMPVAVGVLLCLPWLPGEPTAKKLCAVSLVAVALVAVWVYRRTLRAEGAGYTRAVHRMWGMTTIVALPFIEYYFGFFSPVPVVLSFGIYYFGQSIGRADSFVMPLIVVVLYAVGATLTAFGVVADLGLFPAQQASLASKLFAVVAANFVLCVTLWMARVSRAALREAIVRSNEALLLAQRREAQLAEAQHQLAHALRVAVGKPGRYTGSLAGTYKLGNVIGVGAIGEVYFADHVENGEPAAIKLLQASALVREDLINRILREGTISKQLDHPNIVRVFDCGRMHDGAPYLAMELLEGRDLATRLRNEGQLPLDELVRLATALGAGLQHANDAGVVHRDLKPLNIYEAREGRGLCWKILDFGISKLTSSSGTLTQEGVVGTPGYMSPEQARSGEVDHRSDVFAMGVVLYRALTGQPAFPGENTPQILFDVVYKVPKRPSHVATLAPAELDLVLAIALAKSPEDRFQSAAEFADAFVRACKGELDSELRARASVTMRAYPWATTLTQRG